MYNQGVRKDHTRLFLPFAVWLYPISGYFEQEPPPFWELFCEVNVGKIEEPLDFAPLNLFTACDLSLRHAL